MFVRSFVLFVQNNLHNESNKQYIERDNKAQKALLVGPDLQRH